MNKGQEWVAEEERGAGTLSWTAKTGGGVVQVIVECPKLGITSDAICGASLDKTIFLAQL